MKTNKTFYLQKFVLTALLIAILILAALGQHTVNAAGTGPCDIYASGGTPCVAAHSTVRALYGSYSGNLYQVRRSSDNATRDIGVLSAGGFANAAAQDSFCAGTNCVITVVYDQSGHGNDLWYQGSTQVPGSSVSIPATANKESLTISGNKVYSLFIDPHVSYWRDGHLTGIPTGSAPEGMYMVTSGTHYNSGCCFDYGNSETTRTAAGAGHMDAIYFGSSCWFGGCSGSGPWVQADLEFGLYSGGSQTWNPNQRAFTNRYVTAMLKNNGTTRFALKGSNAQSGSLTTLWDGSLPSGYSPMRKEGAIVLGSGGDCCKPGGGANDSAGTFYEGAMVSGYPSDATDNAIQANIVAAGYGFSGPTPTPPPSQQNPIALYPFDGNTNDASGNGLNATLNGGSFVAGKLNQAVSLNGSGNYVSLPTGIVSNLSDFSIATWVYLNSSSGWNRIFDFGTGTTVNMFLTPQNGSTNAVRFAITTNGGGAEQQITGSSALPTGVWTHVAVTKSGNTGTLYVNGSVVGTNTNLTLSPSSLGSTNQNWLGRSQYSADPYLNGNLDDFRIYNRALSAAEVQSLFNITPTPTPTPTQTPPPSGELLTNGNAESGTSGWAVFGSGTLSANTSAVHGGAQSLLITGRTASWNGISQNVTSKLTNGKSYTTNVWMRTQSGTPTGKVTLALTANGTTNYIGLAQGAVNSSGWTQLTGTATVSWSGTLSSATFYVETTAGTDNFYIDDASFR